MQQQNIENKYRETQTSKYRNNTTAKLWKYSEPLVFYVYICTMYIIHNTRTARPDGDISEAMSRVLRLEVGPKLLVSNNGEQACLECY